MTRISIISLTVALALAGCSTQKERQVASSTFDYVEEGGTVSLKIPADVNTPEYNNEYTIPELKTNPDYVGRKVTILSPALVLPLVTGSHIEDGQKEAVILFDKVDDKQALDTTIWNSLLSYLEEQGIGVDSFDKQQQKLVTDWMLIDIEEDSAWYSWTSTERNIGKRFEFNLELKPHGRTAALKAKLVDYLETVGDDVQADLNPETARRNEIDVLNKVIGHYAQQIRVADAKRLRQIRDGLTMKMGFDSNGEPAFVVDAEYDVTWSRLLLVLRKLGFDVKDLDKSNGVLFLKYEGADAGWWDSLWGSDEDLPIDKARYRMQLGDLGQKTSITMLTDENTPVTAEFMTRIHSAFADTMATDDLDI